ncbi:unnamed protein product [Dracunculus medinensis]|uniref:VWFA domain-containing protein n=1 Tax=Dracunculus medinensis TaxID=318479 RepID=A0A0N4UIP1_DRAME|nr:unnamed protein product [Dracunculus medinensis]
MFTRLPFLCDLHHQLSNSGSIIISQAYNKHRSIFVHNSTSSIAIVLVRQLSPPINSDVVYRNKDDYGCLFNDECSPMNSERTEKFVTSTRIYASALYDRWFHENSRCYQPNILILIVTDGIINDIRKLPHITIHTGEVRLIPILSNIQLESTNGILQGWPLHIVIADLIDQLGYALRDFYALKGGIRVHLIPKWAIYVFIICGILIVTALIIEWYIVRRKLAVKRSISAIQLQAIKSKTHMIFN